MVNFVAYSPLSQFEVNSLFSLTVQLVDAYNLSLTNFSFYILLVIFTLTGLHLYGNNEINLIPSK